MLFQSYKPQCLTGEMGTRISTSPKAGEDKMKNTPDIIPKS